VSQSLTLSSLHLLSAGATVAGRDYSYEELREADNAVATNAAVPHHSKAVFTTLQLGPLPHLPFQSLLS
jgi:hypothetical protein